MKIVLISCASKKLTYKAKCKDMYISLLFKLNLRYAKSMNPDKIFVLSAKYGLLDLDEEIEPYNKTLNTMQSREVTEWSNKVINKLNGLTNIKNDEFIFLAGNRYRKYLTNHLKNHQAPLKGLSIGKQLKYLKEVINE